MTLINSITQWLDSNGPASVATIARMLGEERTTINQAICKNPHRFDLAATAQNGGGKINLWRARRCAYSVPYSPERNQEIYTDYLLGQSLPELSRTYGLTKPRIEQIVAKHRATSPGWECEPVTLESGRTVQAHYSAVNHCWLLADGVTVVWPVEVAA